MADLDQLQIKIESNATPAANAIDKLINSFERLNSQLNNLDVGKVTKFANAINKISNTNASVQATNKGLSELSKHIDSAFGIKKKQGITQIKDAITDLYEAQKAFLASDGNIQLGDNLEKAKSSLAGTIKEFYQLKTSVDETSKSVRDYVKQTADAGTKINIGAMKEEFGEDFKEMMSQLGKFKKAFSTTEGRDFESYISEMKSVLGENIFADKPEQAFKQLIEYTDAIHLVAEELDTVGIVVGEGIHVDQAATDGKLAWFHHEIHVFKTIFVKQIGKEIKVDLIALLHFESVLGQQFTGEDLL